ncbi:MAG: EAL domain-containing protein, partial [Gammaproteobacteria bacterium]|nr:EAL domain-containing protein [Gammaproteobacteria bacterium]
MTGTCTACTGSQRLTADADRLVLSWTFEHAAGAVLNWLKRAGLDHERLAPDVISVSLSDQSPAAALGSMKEELDSAAVANLQGMLVKGDAALSAAMFARMRPMQVLVGLSRAEWLLDCLEQDQLTVHFQPIVQASDTSEVFAHECLLRAHGADGELIGAGDIFAAATAADLMFQVDRTARLAAIREISKRNYRRPVFINFNPTAVYDPNFCLRTTIAAAQQSGLEMDQFVFEIVESSAIEDTERLKDILTYYRRAGCRVALDDLGAGYSSLNLLANLRPDFVKFDRELIDGIAEDDFKQVMLRKLLELARELEILTIAEG